MDGWMVERNNETLVNKLSERKQVLKGIGKSLTRRGRGGVSLVLEFVDLSESC